MCQVIQFHEAELAFYKLTMYLSFEKILCFRCQGTAKVNDTEILD